MTNIKYTEISRAKVSNTRNVVVSRCSKGGFTIAQQLEVMEAEGTTTSVFLRGAFHVDDVHGLYNLRDAVNLAIKVAEDETKPAEDDGIWD